MLKEMQEGIKEEIMQSSMQGLLCKMQLCPAGNLWQQGSLSLLCQIEDQRKQAQVSMNDSYNDVLVLKFCLLCVCVDEVLKLG